MTKRYSVFITYGVIVETDNPEELRELAVQKMFSQSATEVQNGCEIEEVEWKEGEWEEWKKENE